MPSETAPNAGTETSGAPATTARLRAPRRGLRSAARARLAVGLALAVVVAAAVVVALLVGPTRLSIGEVVGALGRRLAGPRRPPGETPWWSPCGCRARWSRCWSAAASRWRARRCRGSSVIRSPIRACSAFRRARPWARWWPSRPGSPATRSGRCRSPPSSARPPTCSWCSPSPRDAGGDGSFRGRCCWSAWRSARSTCRSRRSCCRRRCALRRRPADRLLAAGRARGAHLGSRPSGRAGGAGRCGDHQRPRPRARRAPAGRDGGASMGVDVPRVRLRVCWRRAGGRRVGGCGGADRVRRAAGAAPAPAVVGSGHRALLPLAFVGGGLFVCRPTSSRGRCPPAEIPVGIVTAAMGAPAFLVLLLRRPPVRRSRDRASPRWSRPTLTLVTAPERSSRTWRSRGPGRARRALWAERRGKVDAVAAPAGAPCAARGRSTGGRAGGKLSRREIARRAALLPQDAPVDLPLTVREAVALGRLPHLGRFQPESAADAEAVTRALEATDTTAFAARPLAELSGGERHRVHLARALAQAAPASCSSTSPWPASTSCTSFRPSTCCARPRPRARGVLVALHDSSRWRRAAATASSSSRADGCAADAAPGDVLTPEILARDFGVRAEVRLDGDGRPFVLPMSCSPSTASSG